MPGRNRRTRTGACFAAAAWLAMGQPAGAQAWRTDLEKDGVRLESRPVDGERFDELRVSTSLKAPPEAIADYLFGKYLDEKNRNIERTFVKRGAGTTVWSDVLSTALFKRCYSMRFERMARAGGEVRVRFTSLDYMGQEPKADCVALQSRGEWIMTPVPGGTRLVYASLTDVGGKVPVSLARRSLSSAAVSSVRKVVAGVSGRPLPRGIGD